MFRLLKLFTLAAVGYAVYSFFQDMNAPERAQPRRRSHPQNLSGPGKGRRVQVATDEETSHGATVGRGVIR